MAAWAILSIGKARRLGRAIAETFPAHLDLSGSAWLNDADDDATARAIIERLGIRESGESAIAMRIDPAATHGLADRSIWAFIEEALKSHADRVNRFSPSIYGA